MSKKANRVEGYEPMGNCEEGDVLRAQNTRGRNQGKICQLTGLNIPSKVVFWDKGKNGYKC